MKESEREKKLKYNGKLISINIFFLSIYSSIWFNSNQFWENSMKFSKKKGNFFFLWLYSVSKRKERKKKTVKIPIFIWLEAMLHVLFSMQNSEYKKKTVESHRWSTIRLNFMLRLKLSYRIFSWLWDELYLICINSLCIVSTYLYYLCVCSCVMPFTKIKIFVIHSLKGLFACLFKMPAYEICPIPLLQVKWKKREKSNKIKIQERYP